MFADVLADPTYGVQAQLSALVTGGYIEAGDDAPGTVVVGDSTRNTDPAIGRNMDAPLSVTVFLIDTVAFDGIGEINLLTGKLSIGIRVDATGDLPAVNVTTVGYVVRAVSRSLRWWWRGLGVAGSDAFNKRNGVQFIGGESIRPAMFGATAESPMQTFGVVATATFRDALPD